MTVKPRMYEVVSKMTENGVVQMMTIYYDVVSEPFVCGPVMTTSDQSLISLFNENPNIEYFWEESHNWEIVVHTLPHPMYDECGHLYNKVSVWCKYEIDQEDGRKVWISGLSPTERVAEKTRNWTSIVEN